MFSLTSNQMRQIKIKYQKSYSTVEEAQVLIRYLIILRNYSQVSDVTIVFLKIPIFYRYSLKY